MKFKIKHLIISVLLLLVLLLVSCIQKNKTAEVQEDDGILELTFITQDSVAGPSYEGYMAFAEKLKELSNETMLVEFSQLIKLTTFENIFKKISTGQFDIAAFNHSSAYEIIPETALLGQAYIVNDYEHLLRILDSEYGKNLNDKYYKLGIIPTSVWYTGVRQTTSNIPLNSIADFEGLKFRVPPIRGIRGFARSLGAEPISINFQELYGSMISNIIEAQENALPTIEATKMYEVQKYIAITDHVLGSTVLFVNKDTYENFNDEQKAWYNEAAEYGKQICNTLVYEQEANLLAKFENEYGMTITYPNKSELKAAMTDQYQQLEKEFGNGVVTYLINVK